MYQEAVMGGGGDDWYNVILLTATAGVTITITDGDEEVEIVGTGLQQAVTIHNENSTYTISASENGLSKSASSVTTDTISGKLFTRELKMAAIEVTFDDDFRSQSFTISDGTTTSTSQTFPSTGNTIDIFVPNTGTWKVASSAGGESYESRGAIVTDLDLSYTDEIVVIPNGQTVLPVNDIQTWLACANIKDKTSYTTLADVLNDEVTLVKLMSDSNAVDYLKRSTEWISVNRDGLVPAMTSNTQPEGVAFANIAIAANAYKAFDPTQTSYINPTSGTLMNGYQFTSAKNVKRAVYNLWRQSGNTEVTYTIKLQGSNDGTNYTDLGTNVVHVGTISGLYECVIDAPNNSSNYLYYRVISDENWVTGIGIRSLQFYETTSGEFGITQNELAMKAIGAYDYAANTLLSDSDWKQAIIESEYINDVFNARIPALSGDSSKIIVSSQSSTERCKAYNALDDNWTKDINYSTGKYWYANGWQNQYLGYDFDIEMLPVICRARGESYSGYYSLYDAKIQYSDDTYYTCMGY